MVMEMEMSKTYQYRKVMKPMLERKRRARINKCLDDLKDLMVECLTKEGEHVTRLEKADILELTVEHMKKLKRRGTLCLGSRQPPPSSSDCFRSGYVHAADQISKVLASTPGVDVELGTKLMTYLGQRLNDIQELNVDKVNFPTMITTIPVTPSTPPDNFNVTYNYKASWSPSMDSIQSSPPPPPGCCGDHKQFELKNSVMDLSKDSVWRPW